VRDLLRRTVYPLASFCAHLVSDSYVPAIKGVVHAQDRCAWMCTWPFGPVHTEVVVGAAPSAFTPPTVRNVWSCSPWWRS